MIAMLIGTMAFSGIMTGCGTSTSNTQSSAEAESGDSADSTQGTASLLDTSDMFTKRDLDVSYDESECTTITLDDENSSCDSDAVTIDGQTVTITSEGTYLISGTLSNGSHSNGDVYINAGTLELSTGDDGVHADSATEVSDGSITISQCYEGLEGQIVTISGGVIDITSSDDGLNAAGGSDSSNSNGPDGGDPFSADEDAYISISGGQITIDASGDGRCRWSAYTGRYFTDWIFCGRTSEKNGTRKTDVQRQYSMEKSCGKSPDTKDFCMVQRT